MELLHIRFPEDQFKIKKTKKKNIPGFQSGNRIFHITSYLIYGKKNETKIQNNDSTLKFWTNPN